MSTQTQRGRFEAWKRTVPPVHREEIACMWAAWLAAEAAAIERCAEVCNEVAEEFGPGDWQNASLQCSATIRALLPKEE